MSEYTCERCGKSFHKSRRRTPRFCSRACYDNWRTEASHVTMDCEHCGESFRIHKSLAIGSKTTGKRRFCSAKCRNGHSRGETHACWKQNAPSYPCAHCGKPVRSPHHRLLFCDIRCWRAYQASRVATEPLRKNKASPLRRLGYAVCPACGKQFHKTREIHECCSHACSHEHFQGEKNKTWGGGKYTSEADGRTFLYSRERRQHGRTAGQHLYLLEHRIAVAEFIGRALVTEEKVWHIDCDLSNNVLENLYMFPTQSALMKALSRGLIPLASNLQRLRDDEEYVQSLSDLSPVPAEHAANNLRILQRATVAATLNAVCKHCGEKFHCIPSRIKRTKFCSWACRWASKRVSKTKEVKT